MHAAANVVQHQREPAGMTWPVRREERIPASAPSTVAIMTRTPSASNCLRAITMHDRRGRYHGRYCSRTLNEMRNASDLPLPPPNHSPSSGGTGSDDGEGGGAGLACGLTVLDEGGGEVLGRGGGRLGKEGGEEIELGDGGRCRASGSVLLKTEAGAAIAGETVAIITDFAGIEGAIAAGVDALAVNAEVAPAVFITDASLAGTARAEARGAFPIGGAGLVLGFETIGGASVVCDAVAVVAGFAWIERTIATESAADAIDADAAETLRAIGAGRAEAVEAAL